MAVFENRFPSLATESAEAFGVVEDFPFRSGPGTGRCEVVCFTSDHDTSFAQLSPQHARTVIDALADRTAELSRLPEVEYVFCFENRGEEIGVTLSHPHGQIYGYPFVPPRMLRAARTAADYQDEHGAVPALRAARGARSGRRAGHQPQRALDGAGAVRGPLALRGQADRQPPCRRACRS